MEMGCSPPLGVNSLNRFVRDSDYPSHFLMTFSVKGVIRSGKKSKVWDDIFFGGFKEEIPMPR
jgi:hypothetical protein